MFIDGTIQKVLECPYKQGEVWCELEVETLDQQLYTVMIPSSVYNTTKKECVRVGMVVHIVGNVIESSRFVIAWHVSLKKGHLQNLILEC
ncbi:MAG: hypothetical protein KBT48_11245 [Firmicutes bacterium]|nr:hypothetical protein [Bacillota bacterium]